MIAKYEIGDSVVVNKNDIVSMVSRWNYNEVKLINDIYVEPSPDYAELGADKLVRYRVQGLWFNQDEVKLVSPENDPEYFL